jgi:hypothetical protein
LAVYRTYTPVSPVSSDIQGDYKRNRQFQHFIKPKLVKISALTTHGFVEKLWRFVTATYRCSMCDPQSHSIYVSCQTRFNIPLSTPAVAVVIRCFRSSKVTGTGGTKPLSLTYPLKKSHRMLDLDFVVANM